MDVTDVETHYSWCAIWETSDISLTNKLCTICQSFSSKYSAGGSEEAANLSEMRKLDLLYIGECMVLAPRGLRPSTGRLFTKSCTPHSRALSTRRPTLALSFPLSTHSRFD